MSDEKVTLDEVILAGIDSVLNELNTSLPAKVISYDSSKQSIEAQIEIKRTLKGETIYIPRLVDVPVVFPSGGGFSISFPLVAGDKVIIVFCQRSLDSWLEGEDELPRSKRKFDLSDAFAFPGARQFTDPLVQANGTDLIIAGSGSIKFGSKDASESYVLGDEQRAELNKLLTQMSTLITTLAGWTPILLDGGTALKTALTLSGVFTLPSASLLNTLSPKVKGE